MNKNPFEIFQDLGEEDVFGQQPEVDGLAKVDELERGGQPVEHLVSRLSRLFG